MPKPLVVGIGLRPETAAATILAAIGAVLGEHEIAALATLKARAAEAGPQEAAERLGIPLRAYTAAELTKVWVPNPSIRAGSIGTASVAEAAALIAGGGELIVPKTAYRGVVTIAAADLGKPS
ncbi:cobalamin biosynthesis protein [Nocardia asteroides]|uniref:cobalamin biosynthesis protein n=1 Tax=Nocardia asteroides TaxID=1824 RepID=UPI001E53DCE5|nr:cobalamin biosynthesis protein [Nocardia asteroides]UGT63621.1 cobalamin biosynthesis protein [Nocardia asteroides]